MFDRDIGSMQGGQKMDRWGRVYINDDVGKGCCTCLVCCRLPSSAWSGSRCSVARTCLKTWSFLVFHISHSVLINVGTLVLQHPSSLRNLPSQSSSQEAIESDGWSRGWTLRALTDQASRANGHVWKMWWSSSLSCKQVRHWFSIGMPR